jgi:DNA-nicking Smr family endonuclease
MTKPRKAAPAPLPAEEIAVFREAVQDAQPLPDSGRIAPAPQRRKPVPRRALADETPSPVDRLSDHIAWREDSEAGDETSFLRPGLTRQTLRKLRRGHWVVRDELDLHGMTSDEARASLVQFLSAARDRGARCVRIIHGKGMSSKNREPVLKNRVRSWLMQRDEVLAFAEAGPAGGGAGAVMVLLRGG